jgi:hypothetical protein
MFKDRRIRKFKKGKDEWTLTTTKGTVYPCSAEQPLFRFISSVAEIKGQHVTVKVEPDNKIET